MLSLAIHGDKQQNERDWVLNEFKTGKSPIMVATDVASRGIGMIDHDYAQIPLPPSSINVVWLRRSGALLSAFPLRSFLRRISHPLSWSGPGHLSHVILLGLLLARRILGSLQVQLDLELCAPSHIPHNLL